MPDILLNGESAGKAEGTDLDEVRAMDTVRVLIGGDSIRHTSLFQQTLRFTKWFLQQDAPEDEYNNNGEPVTWDSAPYIAEKWNEFTEKETAKKDS